MPGLNSKTPNYGYTPEQIQDQMRSWKTSSGITGGFVWLYDDILKYLEYGTLADYGAAINKAVSKENN